MFAALAGQLKSCDVCGYRLRRCRGVDDLRTSGRYEGIEALPGADAVWALRAERSLRSIWRGRCLPA